MSKFKAGDVVIAIKDSTGGTPPVKKGDLLVIKRMKDDRYPYFDATEDGSGHAPNTFELYDGVAPSLSMWLSDEMWDFPMEKT